MAIDTANKKRVFLGLYPIPDGSLAATSDRFQMLELYGFGVIETSFDSVSVTLALSILTGHILTLAPNNLPLILEDLDHDLKIH